MGGFHLYGGLGGQREVKRPVQGQNRGRTGALTFRSRPGESVILLNFLSYYHLSDSSNVLILSLGRLVLYIHYFLSSSGYPSVEVQ